jgi:hypothetical protein
MRFSTKLPLHIERERAAARLRSQKFGAGKFLFERPTRLRFTAESRTQGAGTDQDRAPIAPRQAGPAGPDEAPRLQRAGYQAMRGKVISGSLTKIGVSLAVPPPRQSIRNALTMLTEPDMQARYVATTLAVIETELRKADTPAADRSALFALVAGATKVATRLAEDLERPGRRACESVSHSVTPAASRSNVVAFRR